MKELWGWDGLDRDNNFDYNNSLMQYSAMSQKIGDILPDFWGVDLLLDLRDQSYVSVGGNTVGILGYSKEELKEGGFNAFNNLIPEKEWLLLKRHVWPEMIDYVKQSVSVEEWSNVLFQLNYHIRHKSGELIHIQESQRPIWTDLNGKMLLGYSHVVEINTLDQQPVIGSVKHMTKLDGYKLLFQKNYSMSILFDKLTSREAEVARLLTQGLSSKTIAEMLFLSPHTVDTYRRRIIKKLNIKSTAKLG